jgi:hypothetical protein
MCGSVKSAKPSHLLGNGNRIIPKGRQGQDALHLSIEHPGQNLEVTLASQKTLYPRGTTPDTSYENEQPIVSLVKSTDYEFNIETGKVL